MSKTVVLYDGTIVSVPDDVAEGVQSAGMGHERTSEEAVQGAEDARRIENAGGTGGAIGAALEGAADTLTFGGYGALADAYSPGYQDRAAEHPYARMGGEIAGMFVPGAEFTAVGAAEGLGEAVTSKLASKGASSFAARSAGKLAEGAAFGVGGEIANAESSGDQLTIEGIAYGAGLGGALNWAVDLGAQKLLGFAAKKAAKVEEAQAELTETAEKVNKGIEAGKDLKDPTSAHNDFVDLMPDAKEQRLDEIRSAKDTNRGMDRAVEENNKLVDQREQELIKARRDAVETDMANRHDELVRRNEELIKIAEDHNAAYEAAKAEVAAKGAAESTAQTPVQAEAETLGEATTAQDKRRAELAKSIQKKSAKKAETIAVKEAQDNLVKYAEVAASKEKVDLFAADVKKSLDQMKTKLDNAQAALGTPESTMSEQSIAQSRAHLKEVNKEFSVALQANQGKYGNKVRSWIKTPGAARDGDLAMRQLDKVRQMMSDTLYSYEGLKMWEKFPRIPHNASKVVDETLARIKQITDQTDAIISGADHSAASASSAAEAAAATSAPSPADPAALPSGPSTPTADPSAYTQGPMELPKKIGKFEGLPASQKEFIGPLTKEQASIMMPVEVPERMGPPTHVEVPDKLPAKSVPRKPADFAKLSDVALDKIGKSVITDAQKSALEKWATEIGVQPGDSPSKTLVSIRDALKVRQKLIEEGTAALQSLKASGDINPKTGLLRTSIKLGLAMYMGRAANWVLGGGLPGALGWQVANRGTKSVLESVDRALFSKAAIADRAAAQMRVTSVIAKATKSLGRTSEAMAAPVAFLSTSILGGKKAKGDIQTLAAQRSAEVQRIARMAPDAIFSAIQPMLGMENNIALKVHQHIVGAIQHLADTAPKDPGTAVFGGKSLYKPSYAEALAFSCRMEAAFDPDAALVRALSPGAHPAGVDTLWKVWPGLMTEAAQQLAAEPNLLAHADYPRLSQLSTFLRADLTGLNNPQKSLAVQGLFLPQQSGGPPSSSSSSSGRGPGRPGVPPMPSTGTLVQNNQR